jgi:hypothetical protein
MSDTPETDAFFAEWTRTDGVLARSRLHAEKLERERDAAIIKYAGQANELSHKLLEARYQNAKLRDIAERAVAGLEAKYKLHSGADIQLGIRDELNQLKEGAK